MKATPYQQHLKRRARREFWRAVSDMMPMFMLLAVLTAVRFIITFA